MNAIARMTSLALLTMALGALGCGQQDESHTNTGPRSDGSAPTPAEASEIASARAAEKAAESAAASAPAVRPAKAGEAPAAASEKPAPAAAAPVAAEAPAAGSEGAVSFEKVSYDSFLKWVASNPKKARYTIVDAWASWCAPCKENFPHLLEMHHKYGPKGLAVASLSFDDPANAKQVDDARGFLQQKKADCTNFLLDEPEGVGFEKFNINAIPAVFLYGPDGKEVKRFTLDDPNNQFTYDEVEKVVAGLLEAK